MQTQRQHMDNCMIMMQDLVLHAITHVSLCKLRYQPITQRQVAFSALGCNAVETAEKLCSTVKGTTCSGWLKRCQNAQTSCCLATSEQLSPQLARPAGMGQEPLFEQLQTTFIAAAAVPAAVIAAAPAAAAAAVAAVAAAAPLQPMQVLLDAVHMHVLLQLKKAQQPTALQHPQGPPTLLLEVSLIPAAFQLLASFDTGVPTGFASSNMPEAYSL
eukprot:363363-Chlamydomonas_euryale.AAC.10